MRMDRRSRPPCPKEEEHRFILGVMGQARPHLKFILPVANDKATFTREKGKRSPQVGNERLRQRDTQLQAAPILPKAARGPRDRAALQSPHRRARPNAGTSQRAWLWA